VGCSSKVTKKLNCRRNLPSNTVLKNENVEMDLAASVYTDDVAAVRRELAERPDRAFERSRGQSLLHKAVSAETVSLLLAAGVGVDDREERGGFTPLFRAIQSASLPAVSALLKHGADPNARGDDGSAPLHKLTSWAPRDESQVGEVEAIGRLLIDAGAMIEPIARDGTTPLRLAARHGRLRLVRLLVAVGADPLLRDLYGSNALDESRPHPEVAKWLRGWAVHNGVSFAPKVSAADVVDLPHGMLRFHQATDRALAMAGPSVITGWATDGQPELRFFAVSDLAEIIDLAFAPDGASFVIARRHDPIEVRAWDRPDEILRTIRSTEAHGAIGVSPDGNLLAVRGAVEDLHVIDLRTDTIVATVESGEHTRSVTFSPDGRLLAVAMSYQGGASIEVHDVDEYGHLTARYEIERAYYQLHPVPFIDTLEDVCFAPDGTAFAIWETSAIGGNALPGWRGNVALFVSDTGALLWETKIDGHITGTMDSLNTIDLPMGYRTDIAFSIDSTRIAIGLDERLVELDAATGTVITVQTALGRLSSVVASASVHGWITAGTTGVCLVTRPSR
jgi:Ankyrin repeats (3 copies)/Ankyrin repeat